MIDSPPEVVPLAVNLHEDLVEVPLPAAGLHPLDPSFSNLRCKHRTKPVPPVAHRLMADIDAPLMQKIFDVAKRKRETHVEHHRQADDLWARLEVAEVAAFRHAGTLASDLPLLKLSSSDSSLQSSVKRTHCIGAGANISVLPSMAWCTLSCVLRNFRAYLRSPEGSHCLEVNIGQLAALSAKKTFEFAECRLTLFAL